MTSAFLLLMAAGTIALIVWIVVAFLQFLLSGGVFVGLGSALVQLQTPYPGDFEIMAMMAVMLCLILALYQMLIGWRAGLRRMRAS